MATSEEIIDKIIMARVGLLFKQPFFGNLAVRMKLIDATEWCSTAATDFKNLYYNRDWFAEMDLEEVKFVLAHEILHCIFDHLGRQEMRNHKIFNYAADFCVNGVLTRDRIGTMPKSIPGLHDTKYYGWSAEQVYDDLMKNYTVISISELGDLLDEHLESEDDGESNPNKPKLSKEELRALRDEIREAVIQSAQQCSDAGKVPVEIQRMIKDITEPKMNWRDLIRQQIQSTIKSDFSFMRPNRKSQHLNAILPGSNVDTAIDCALFFDMSGSIGTAEAKDMLSEVKGIVEEFRDYTLLLGSWDCDVHNVRTYTMEDGDEILEYQPVGGGGTDLNCVYEYLDDNGIVPKKLIVFTDYYLSCEVRTPDYCDTLLIIHGNPNCVPEYGEYAHYSK